jgi:ABC-type glutathione transport system ATPase component
LEVSNLRKVYQEDLIAVDDVSFTVNPSSSLGIVGESGSGKTTVARMLVGLETRTAGRILFDGDDRSLPAHRTAERRRRGRDIQLVPQDPYTSLDPRQTVSGCLDEVLRLHRALDRAGRRARVRELADLVGLDTRQTAALPRALSGGQRQRVAIARALAAEPRVIVLDESVSALDVSIQAQVLNLLADIRDEVGVTYILISHDLAVVRQLTEHAIVMRRGRIVERGATDRILDHPQDAYTRLLRDSVPEAGWTPVRRGAA